MNRCTRNRVVLGLGLVAAGGLALASPAFAGGDKGEKGEKKQAFIEREMRMMDTNGDQRLSADEHAAGARRMFEQMDTNKDARVTAEEMRASYAAIRGEAAKPEKAEKVEMAVTEKIKTIDTNGDGALSAEEHANGARTMFGLMDTSKDGTLSKEELTSGHARLMQKHHDNK
jgi:Ca2+-binding EF-hand superfamily protein